MGQWAKLGPENRILVYLLDCGLSPQEQGMWCLVIIDQRIFYCNRKQHNHIALDGAGELMIVRDGTTYACDDRHGRRARHRTPLIRVFRDDAKMLIHTLDDLTRPFVVVRARM